MSDTTELNDKLVSELREMAKSLGVAEADELRKPQLISRIIEQNQLIEAAKAQQNTVESNYSPIKTTASEAAAETGERTRKRIRTIKPSKNEPRVEVPLDDTNLFVRAFRLSDASLVAPLVLITPVLLLVTSPLILGEHVPPLGALGVIFAVLGSAFLGGSSRSVSLRTSFIVFARDHGVRSMFVTAVIWSITSNLDKLGVRASTPLC